MVEEAVYRFHARRRRNDPAAEERRLLNQAYCGFNTHSDPDLVESYVFEINALQSRYSYLVRRMKDLEHRGGLT